MINELGEKIFDNAMSKGFWPTGIKTGLVPIDIPQKLLLIISEITEAMEADRKRHFIAKSLILKHEKEFETKEDFLEWFNRFIKDSFEDELADACIRIFDLAHAMDINLEYHIKAKMKYNASRPIMHGGKKY